MTRNTLGWALVTFFLNIFRIETLNYLQYLYISHLRFGIHSFENFADTA